MTVYVLYINQCVPIILLVQHTDRRQAFKALRKFNTLSQRCNISRVTILDKSLLLSKLCTCVIYQYLVLSYVVLKCILSVRLASVPQILSITELMQMYCDKLDSSRNWFTKKGQPYQMYSILFLLKPYQRAMIVVSCCVYVSFNYFTIRRGMAPIRITYFFVPIQHTENNQIPFFLDQIYPTIEQRGLNKLCSMVGYICFCCHNAP